MDAQEHESRLLLPRHARASLANPDGMGLVNEVGRLQEAEARRTAGDHGFQPFQGRAHHL